MTYKEVDANTEMWMPEKEGDQLEGVVIQKEDGLYGLQLRLETSPGVTQITPSHKVLQARLDSINIGDRIRITYKGEEPPSIKGNNPTKIYKVERDEPEEIKVE